MQTQGWKKREEDVSMKASIIKSDGKSSTVLLESFKLSLVNSLRRAMMNSVDTLAIEDVTIFKNTSSMYDEVLASRLGLVPLKTLPELSKSKKEISFKLKETGPKTVHASDLIPSDKDIIPVYPDTLLLNLKEGESVELEAKAVFGRGSDHVKFSPAHVSYHFYPVIDIKKGSIKGAAEVASLCPVNILEGNGNDLSVKKGMVQDCILCKACEDYAGQDSIKISSDPDKIVFDVDNWGQLDTAEIFKQALDSLNEELKELGKKI